MADDLTLLIDGRRYWGWSSVRVSAGIDRCVSDFRIEVSERWTGQGEDWKILPFAACQVLIDDEPVLTGYVEEYSPSIGAVEHRTTIAGKSKTGDLVECTPEILGGQFRGYSLAAIARAVCAPFGVAVVVGTSAADMTFQNVQIERCETGFSFLERLGRLAGVLLTDDANGNLLLTTAGQNAAAGALVEGVNIQAATARLSSHGRYSQFIVKGQSGLSAGTSVQTGLRAEADDASVPRYRPRVVIAESQLSLAQMQQRANWLRQRAFGMATSADITLAGWRQADGSLWQPNLTVPVTSSALGVDADLLIARVEFNLSAQSGRTTTLHVGPVQAFTPDPGAVRMHKAHGKRRRRGGCPTWHSAGGIE